MKPKLSRRNTDHQCASDSPCKICDIRDFLIAKDKINAIGILNCNSKFTNYIPTVDDILPTLSKFKINMRPLT